MISKPMAFWGVRHRQFSLLNGLNKNAVKTMTTLFFLEEDIFLG